MRFILIIYIVLCASITMSFAQGNYPGSNVPYESCTNCTNTNYNYSGQIDHYDTEQIISDFGPRYLSTNTPYDFHGGIDYTATLPNNSPPNDLGYHVVAIEGGTILRLRNYNNGTLKYMVIDGSDNNDYGYLHLFDDTAVPTTIGDMSYVTLTNFQNPGTEIYAIYDLSNNALLSDCGGSPCTQIHYYVNGTDTIYATNQVTANMRIGILGTSGNVGSHLHLSKYNTLTGISDFVNNDGNAIDPLEICAHEGPNYDVKILRDSTVSNINLYPSGIKLAYPGHDVSPILIRPIMPDVYNGQPNNGVLSNSNRYYVDNSMNIHKTEIFIKNSDNQNFTNIQGPFYHSRFNLGAKLNDHTKYPSHISVRNANSVGSWMRTGIKPLAYKTNSPRRWDDFYFSDFVTRIHESDPMDADTTPTMIADIPAHARYPDGPMDIMAEVVDVRDSVFRSDTFSLILDNFYPHVVSVATSISGNEVGFQEILGHDPDVEIVDNGYIYPGVYTPFAYEVLNPPTGQDLNIEVITSEPMDTMSIFLPQLLPTVGSFRGMMALDSTRTRWGFDINDVTGGTVAKLHQDSCYNLILKGMDLSGNPILNLGKYTAEQSDQMHVPTRQDTSGTYAAWNNLDTNYVGEETLFSFCIYNCEAPENNNCNYSISDVTEHAVPINGGLGSITVLSSTLYDYIEFTDGSGNVIQSGVDSVLENVMPGIYCYTVWVDCCPKSSCTVVESCLSRDIYLDDDYGRCEGDSVSYQVFFSGTNNLIDTNLYEVTWWSPQTSRLYYGNPWNTVAEVDTINVIVQELATECYLTDTIIIVEAYSSNFDSINPEFQHNIQCLPTQGYILLSNRLPMHDSVVWFDNQSTDYDRYDLSSGEYCVQIYQGLCDTTVCIEIDSILNDSCNFPINHNYQYADCYNKINLSIQALGDGITILLYDSLSNLIDSVSGPILEVDSLPLGVYYSKVIGDCCVFEDTIAYDSPQLCIMNSPIPCWFQRDTVVVNFCDSNNYLNSGYYTYDWVDFLGNVGDTNVIEDFFIHPTQFYVFTVTDTLGCSFEDTIRLDYIAEPIFRNKEVVPVSTCAPGSILLTAGNWGNSYDGIIWNDTVSQDTFRYIYEAGTYSYNLIYGDGQCSRDSISVIVPFEASLDSITEDSITILDEISYCDTVIRYGEINIYISDSILGELDSFRWQDVPGHDSLKRNMLTSGTYCLTYFIQGGCQITKCYQIETRELRPEVRVVSSRMPECYNDNGDVLCNGQLDISFQWPNWLPIEYHNTSYTFRWKHPDGSYSYNEDLSGECPQEGNFILQINYNGGCPNEYFFRMCCCEFEAGGSNESLMLCVPGQPYAQLPQIEVNLNNPKTQHSSDGSIWITSFHANPPKTITWTGPNGFYAFNTTVIQNLMPGTYCVEVGIPGCIQSYQKECYELTTCASIDILPNETIIPPCMGDMMGSIQLAPSGGSNPYRYLWLSDPGGYESNIEGINGGTYTVRVEEGGGCLDTFDIVVTDTVVTLDSANCQWLYESCGQNWTEPCKTTWVIDQNDCRFKYKYCHCTDQNIDTMKAEFVNPTFDENCNYNLPCPWSDEIITGGPGDFVQFTELEVNEEGCKCYEYSQCITPFGSFNQSPPQLRLDTDCEDFDTWLSYEVRQTDEGLCACYEVTYCGNISRTQSSEVVALLADDQTQCGEISNDIINTAEEGSDGFLDCYRQNICIVSREGIVDTTFGSLIPAGEPSESGEWNYVSLVIDPDEVLNCYREVYCSKESFLDSIAADLIPAGFCVDDTTVRYLILCENDTMGYSCEGGEPPGIWPSNGGSSSEYMNLFPNPTNDKVWLTSKIQIQGIQVYNIAGVLLENRIVKHEEKITSFSINLALYPSGVYFIKAYAESGLSKTFRVVKIN